MRNIIEYRQYIDIGLLARGLAIDRGEVGAREPAPMWVTSLRISRASGPLVGVAEHREGFICIIHHRSLKLDGGSIVCVGPEAVCVCRAELLLLLIYSSS